MSNIDPRQLYAMLQQDASRMGISVEELINRITSGAHAIGAAPSREMIDPATYMSTGQGNMPQIQDRLPDEQADDFDEFAQAREDALATAGGDDLAREILFRESKIAKQAQVAAFSRAAPATAANSPLGRQVILTGPGNNVGLPVYTDPLEICAWVGDDGDTRPVTVTFGPIPFTTPIRNFSYNPANGSQAMRPLGRIMFGTSGFLLSADLDILNGCQFTVNASQVRLQALLAGPSLDMQFTGMISFQPCVRTAPLYCTRYANGIDGGASSTTRVPPFAKKVRVRRHNSAIAYTFTLTNTNNNTIYTITVAAGAEMTEFLEIPGDAYTYTVANTLAPGTAGDFDITFELGL